MGYYEGEKSIGLGPIVIGLSVVAACGFGLLYYTCAHPLQPAGASNVAPAPEPVPTGAQGNHV
jgi:hypothetical protein